MTCRGDRAASLVDHRQLSEHQTAPAASPSLSSGGVGKLTDSVVTDCTWTDGLSAVEPLLSQRLSTGTID